MGVALGPEWLEKCVGEVDADIWRALAREFGLRQSETAMLDAKNKAFERIAAQRGIPSVAGVEALLDALWGRVPLAIATSSPRVFLSDILNSKGWGGRFDASFCRDDVARPKPHPEIYLRAAESLGAEPADCAAIEDSPPGLEAAHAAGLRAAGLATNFPRGRLHRAAIVFDSLSDLPAILEFLGLAP